MSLARLISGNSRWRLTRSRLVFRNFSNLSSILLFSLGLLFPFNAHAQAEAKKPNIFIILSDDSTRRDLGFSGNNLFEHQDWTVLRAKGWF